MKGFSMQFIVDCLFLVSALVLLMNEKILTAMFLMLCGIYLKKMEG